jgi:hypothetical protein
MKPLVQRKNKKYKGMHQDKTLKGIPLAIKHFSRDIRIRNEARGLSRWAFQYR